MKRHLIFIFALTLVIGGCASPTDRSGASEPPPPAWERGYDR